MFIALCGDEGEIGTVSLGSMWTGGVELLFIKLGSDLRYTFTVGGEQSMSRKHLEFPASSYKCQSMVFRFTASLLTFGYRTDSEVEPLISYIL